MHTATRTTESKHNTNPFIKSTAGKLKRLGCGVCVQPAGNYEKIACI